MQARQLVWLRNDLRLDDNPALSLGQQAGPIDVIYIATPEQWQAHNESPARLGLRAGLIEDITTRLAASGIAFHYLELPYFSDIPQALLILCQQLSISTLWFQRETPVHECQRDDAVEQILREHSVAVHALPPDLVVNLPVLTQQQEPFKVFTPYYRRWLTLLQQNLRSPYPAPKQQSKALPSPKLTLPWAGEFRADLWPANEQIAQQRLNTFCEHKRHHYKEQRDYPAQPATSTLSPYLALGVLGPRRMVEAVQFSCGHQGSEWQHDDWLRELAWRDFYRQLMVHFPRLSKGKPFKPETDFVRWKHNPEDFQAWCQGKTGFPIIDAAMRQLNQTGWMHNRLRMVAASFLTKLLLTDWRKGEQYFMEHLIDGEFAANNGGWQWSASTGCDAAPYFRVFNPTAQSEKFDAQGEFIRRFVPELQSLKGKQIHNPPDELRRSLGYPLPIIDYKQCRIDAIDAFKDLKNF